MSTKGCDENKVREKIFSVLKTVYDPEIPVNIVDLGLVYEVKVDRECNVEVLMTLTAPGCPLASILLYQVKDVIESEVPEVKRVNVKLTFNPPWTPERVSPRGRELLKKIFGYDVVEEWIKRVKKR